MKPGLCSRLSRFAADRRANVVIIFALALLPMLGMTALAVDYSQSLAVKAKLDTAADAAAIAGIAAAKNYIQSYSGTSSNSQTVNAQAIAAGNAAAQYQFNANAGKFGGGANPVTMSASPLAPYNGNYIAISGNSITGKVSYSYVNPTPLGKLLGKSSVTISNTAASATSLPLYADVYIVIDNSESMGIGATWQDQCNLYNLTGQYNLQRGQTAGTCTYTSSTSGYGRQDTGRQGSACVLACHQASINSRAVNTEQLANCAANPSITLRLDVAKQAVTDALSALPTNGNVQVAIYRMSNTLTTVVSLTKVTSGSLPGINAAVNGTKTTCNSSDTGIQLGTAYGEGGTDISNSLDTLRNSLPTAGNGASASNPLGFVIVVSDSVQDNLQSALTLQPPPLSNQNFNGYYPNWGGENDWEIGTFDPAPCAAIKNKGYQLYTLYVDYIVPPPNSTGAKPTGQDQPNVLEAFQTPYHNNTFPTMFSWIAANAIPAEGQPNTYMQSCASSAADYFSANQPQDIENAMQQIIKNITATYARLTQ